jgi:hypothetical protein
VLIRRAGALVRIVTVEMRQPAFCDSAQRRQIDRANHASNRARIIKMVLLHSIDGELLSLLPVTNVAIQQD